MQEAIQKPSTFSEKPVKKIWLMEKEIACCLSISVSPLHAHRQDRKELPYVKFGRLVRYAATDVLLFMQQHVIKAESF